MIGGALSLGQLVAFNAYLALLVQPINGAVNVSYVQRYLIEQQQR